LQFDRVAQAIPFELAKPSDLSSNRLLNEWRKQFRSSEPIIQHWPQSSTNNDELPMSASDGGPPRDRGENGLQTWNCR
jgi:hypothetical protein